MYNTEIWFMIGGILRLAIFILFMGGILINLLSITGGVREFNGRSFTLRSGFRDKFLKELRKAKKVRYEDYHHLNCLTFPDYQNDLEYIYKRKYNNLFGRFIDGELLFHSMYPVKVSLPPRTYLIPFWERNLIKLVNLKIKRTKHPKKRLG